MRLKTKFTLSIIFLVGVSVLAVGGFTIVSQKKRLQAELKTHHIQLSRQIAQASEESLYQSNLVFLNAVERMKGERGFHSAMFVDMNLFPCGSGDNRRL